MRSILFREQLDLAGCLATVDDICHAIHIILGVIGFGGTFGAAVDDICHAIHIISGAIGFGGMFGGRRYFPCDPFYFGTDWIWQDVGSRPTTDPPDGYGRLHCSNPNPIPAQLTYLLLI